jgi:hypothetical protein
MAAASVLAPLPAVAAGEPVTVTAQTDRGSARLTLRWRRPPAYTVTQAPPFVFIIGQPRFVHYRRGNAVTLVWIGVGHEPARIRTPGDREQRAKPPVKAGVPPASPAAPQAAKPAPAPAAPAPAAPAPPSTTPPSTEAHNPPAAPVFDVSHRGAATTISLATPDEVGAAVFRYGGHIWIVFSRPETFDLAPYRRRLGPGLRGLMRLDNPQATVLLVRASGEVGADVTRRDHRWVVVLAAGRAPRRDGGFALKKSRGGDEVTIPLPGAARAIGLVAPDVGSTLHIVTSRADAAIGESGRFVAFRILPAAQGAVIEARADKLTVSATADGIVIRRAGGLLLSPAARAGGSPQSQ